MYAPFVRKIYIVTDRQCPKWLNLSKSDRVCVIDHTDIFDRKYLPSFNSDAIESCLYNIDGLSERFIYCNDDFMFLSSIVEGDFFDQAGNPIFYPSPRKLPGIFAEDALNYTTHAHLMCANLLGFNKSSLPFEKLKHIPYAVTRSTFKALEGEFPLAFHSTRESKIRSEKSYALLSFLYPNVLLQRGQATRGEASYKYVDLADPTWQSGLRQAMQSKNVKFLCLNDSSNGLTEGEESDLITLLESRYPVPAPWEE